MFENSVSSITVSGTTADSNATVSYDPAQPSSLVVGANTILVTVTAEDGVTTKDYEITVNRADPNTDLGALSVSDGTLVPSFSTSTLAYMVNVEILSFKHNREWYNRRFECYGKLRPSPTIEFSCRC